MGRFSPRTSIAIRTHRFEQIRTANAAIVVEDHDETISYWWPAGAEWFETAAMTARRQAMLAETLSELEESQ